ncbi:MAG: hypothetical protein LBV71_16990 [Prevotella sp.]|jgi:hypothetical protein|nr:hypothetical protein [Prevotella sp.]
MKNKSNLGVMFLLSIFIFSCQQEDYEIENNDKSNSHVLKSTSIPSIASQLSKNKIPFYIQSANTGEYLTINKATPMTKAKDTSASFQWYFETGSFMGYLLKNAVGNGNNKYLGFPISTASLKSQTPTMTASTASGYNYWMIQSLTNNPYFYNIVNARQMHMDPNADKTNVYLTSLTDKNHSCVLRAKDYVSNQAWSIIPIGEYVIKKVSYILSTDDVTTMRPTYLMNLPLTNNTPSNVVQVVKVAFSYIEKSGFSDTHGTTINIKNSSEKSFSVPNILGGKTNTETTTSESWSYTKSQEKTKTFALENTVTITVPPYSNYKAMVSASEYTMNATYVMELVHAINGGEPIIVSGKWNGIQVHDMTFVIDDGKGNIVRKQALTK